MTSSTRSPLWRKLALAGVGVGFVLVGAWWFTPGLYDRLVYGEVSRQCDEPVSIRGEVEGVAVSGRHCRIGDSMQGTEVGYFITFEYARDGRVMLWGRGRPPTEPGPDHVPDVAMLRTPGDAGTWLCAGQARWSVEASGEHELIFEQVGVLSSEPELESAGGTLRADTEQMEVEIGHWLATVGYGGASCDQDLERCQFRGDEQQAIRAFVRSSGPDDDEGYAFVTRDNQRAARHVDLSVSTDVQPSLDPMNSVELRELSAWARCPLEHAGDGEVRVRWTP